MTHTIHLFLDFENVKPSPQDIALIRGAHIQLWVLRGPQQNKFDADLAEAWQPLGNQVHFVRSSKSGKNALDFHIAFCLGAARQQDIQQGRQACYIVISGDKGFEALFGYINSLGSRIGRAGSVPDALKLAVSLKPDSPANVPTVPEEKKPAPQPQKPKPSPKPAPPASDVDRVLAHLRDQPRTRPTTRKKLEHHVTSILGNKIEPPVVIKVIDELTKKRILVFDGTKVRYEFPKVKK